MEVSLILHLAIKGLRASATQLRKYLDIEWTFEVAAVVATLSLITQAQTHTRWSLDSQKAKCMLRKLFTHLKEFYHCIELSLFLKMFRRTFLVL